MTLLKAIKSAISVVKAYIKPDIVSEYTIQSIKNSCVLVITQQLAIEYLVIGSGGGGSAGVANQYEGSGGGAGEVKMGILTLNPGEYTITVGVGGLGGLGNGTAGGNGNSSSIASLIIALGGNGAPTGQTGGTSANGYVGGSGTTIYGGGGGGSGSPANGADGGFGTNSNITGTTISYAQGGSATMFGGTTIPSPLTYGSGGGNGYVSSNVPGKNGINGIVIIKYLT